MNKIIKKVLLIILFEIFFLPTTTEAKVNSPKIKYYDIIVTNEEGVSLYDWNISNKVGTLDKDEKYTVISEKYNYDEETLYLEININGSFCFIKNEGISLEEKEVFPTEKDLLEKPVKKYVFQKGVKLYKGPSFVYDEVTGINIPVGTILDSSYGNDAWLYVEYENNKGWIYQYSYGEEAEYGKKDTGLYTYKVGKLYTLDDITVYKKWDKKEENFTIPRGNEVVFKYIYSNAPTEFGYYINYNGKTGWIFRRYEIGLADEHFIERDYQKIYLVHETNVYYDYDCKEKITTINGNKEFATNYKYFNTGQNNYHFDSYLIEYEDGKFGWIQDIYEKESPLAQKSHIEYKVTNDVNIFEKPTKESNIIANIKADSKLLSLYYEYDTEEQWIYINDGINTGWVLVDEENVLYVSSYFIDDDIDPEIIEEFEDSFDNYFLWKIIIAFIFIGLVFIGFIIIKKKNKG